ncbi:MAG: hypothetical protein CVV24_11330 [Ignavibacteriae bacterium HGW-Ignavibacteriae-3]|nr:MAG: hypothetical protein CVV24_11330 [Ignavibacteriae bacterium HGW-Ignavibacteriae-3]
MVEIIHSIKSSLEEILALTLQDNELIIASKEIGKNRNDFLAAQQIDMPENYLSIITPFKGSEENVINLIHSVKNNVTYQNYAVIIVAHENQKINNVVNECAGPNIMVFAIPERISLMLGCEIAANLAYGHNIVFINSMLEIKPLSIEYLLNFSASTNSKVITSKIVNGSNKIEEAGYSIIEDNMLVGNGVGKKTTAPAFNYSMEISTSSRYCLFITRDILEKYSFDKNISDFGLALYDLGLQLQNDDIKIFYQPLSVLKLGKNKTIPTRMDSSLQPESKFINSLRPTIFINDSIGESKEIPRKNILVLGVYLGDRLNNVEDIVLNIHETVNYNIKQKWVAINRTSSNELVLKYTVNQFNRFIPKFEILNELINRENIYDYDYILTVDDDIVLPKNFIDGFIKLQNLYDFVLAQPARSVNSYIDHPIVQKQNGVVARETHFVEIGPVFSIRKDIYDIILPFDLSSPMGWGYENIWAKKIFDQGLKMGIIDSVPVDHSLRKPVANYAWSVADEQRAKILQNNSHFELVDCFTVSDVKS